jgi:hypothetical protein
MPGGNTCDCTGFWMKYSTNYNINAYKKYQFAGAGKILANRHDGETRLYRSRAHSFTPLYYLF